MESVLAEPAVPDYAPHVVHNPDKLTDMKKLPSNLENRRKLQKCFII